MTPELPWSNSRTVLNLSGPRCGTVTRMVKTPGTTEWTTVEGTRPGLWWPAMEKLMTASEKADLEGDRQREARKPRQHLVA